MVSKQPEKTLCQGCGKLMVRYRLYYQYLMDHKHCWKCIVKREEALPNVTLKHKPGFEQYVPNTIIQGRYIWTADGPQLIDGVPA